ncbi:unnamed protein product [Bemisia tabaci]|uniref:Uncharacterized protein n=1 Tax=Bemisia tabaci TaxID=7038 RepID=A0A9P0A5X4_BEMTA|nr:unnamed protein product [Bemisia tabaci]
MTDVLSSKFTTSLRITPDKIRLVGDDRIKKAQANNEDVAVLTSFLPEALADAATQAKNLLFECALKNECRLGNPKLVIPGE